MQIVASSDVLLVYPLDSFGDPLSCQRDLACFTLLERTLNCSVDSPPGISLSSRLKMAKSNQQEEF